MDTLITESSSTQNIQGNFTLPCPSVMENDNKLKFGALKVSAMIFHQKFLLGNTSQGGNEQINCTDMMREDLFSSDDILVLILEYFQVTITCVVSKLCKLN